METYPHTSRWPAGRELSYPAAQRGLSPVLFPSIIRRIFRSNKKFKAYLLGDSNGRKKRFRRRRWVTFRWKITVHIIYTEKEPKQSEKCQNIRQWGLSVKVPPFPSTIIWVVNDRKLVKSKSARYIIRSTDHRWPSIEILPVDHKWDKYIKYWRNVATNSYRIVTGASYPKIDLLLTIMSR